MKREPAVVCENCGKVIPISESIERDITPEGAGMSFRKVISICKNGCESLEKNKTILEQIKSELPKN